MSRRDGRGRAILPGTTQLLQLNLERGRYVLVCHVPSADGTLNVAKGMIREVTVS